MAVIVETDFLRDVRKSGLGIDEHLARAGEAKADEETCRGLLKYLLEATFELADG